MTGDTYCRLTTLRRLFTLPNLKDSSNSRTTLPKMNPDNTQTGIAEARCWYLGCEIRVWPSVQHRNEHISEHRLNNAYYCPLVAACQTKTTFGGLGKLLVHLDRVHGKVDPLDRCPYPGCSNTTRTTQDQLIAHGDIAHESAGQTFDCPMYGCATVKFKQWRFLLSHLKLAHDIVSGCSQLPSISYTEREPPERNYYCWFPLCQKYAWSDPKSLMQHGFDTHSDVSTKRFKCPWSACESAQDEGYQQFGNLNVHLERMHLPTGLVTSQCPGMLHWEAAIQSHGSETPAGEASRVPKQTGGERMDLGMMQISTICDNVPASSSFGPAQPPQGQQTMTSRGGSERSNSQVRQQSSGTPRRDRSSEPEAEPPRKKGGKGKEREL